MNEFTTDPESDIVASFHERMDFAESIRRQFERTIGSMAPAVLTAQLWHVMQTQGDSVICETYIHDLMSGYVFPALLGHLTETKDSSFHDRLVTIIGVMDEKVKMLGSATVKAHEMKASKLQRAIIETTVHAEYKACYTVRRLAVDGLATLSRRPPTPEGINE